MSSKRRFAVVGTGGRAGIFIQAVTETYRDSCELAALCDLSQTRMDWHNQQLHARTGLAPAPTYHASQFDRMITDTRPDTVIVATVDATHHLYINRAMEMGCDVISEKPMTTDVDKARSIFETIEKTGKKLGVTFNYRYAPAFTKLRELVMQRVVGRPLSVDLSWLLDTYHGADYFRRWHREKHNSGGLLVHKATHHF
ncbi:MAG: Gfo/Idh/MocA family oxidoreductase, partial [Rhodococcus sp.]|nr:Gfo/Idh/MocA family oxidoreductase [Rhodococcus sp. (in: high G+C Gram-positive bacteria)]